MHKDTIVGIAGAVILVAAMAGVFWYEGTRGAVADGARSFSVSFAPDDVNGPTASDTASVGSAQDKALRIATGNLTKVRFTLVWTDDQANTNPDSFTLKIVGPDGIGEKTVNGANAANGRGEIFLDFPLGEVPVSTTVNGDTAEQAEARAMAQNARALGMGAWNVTVTLTAAGGAVPGAPVLGLPVEDNTNSWELKTILTAFAASAE